MIDYLGMVRQFHNKYGHFTSDELGIPSEEVAILRYKLIEEEMYETLGPLRNMFNYEINDDELVSLADGIADCLVVLFGTALAFGIPIEEVFKEVHRSNMTKSAEKNEYGKTIKGDKYEPPKIREILDNYRRLVR